jgi:hypothetical protein
MVTQSGSGPAGPRSALIKLTCGVKFAVTEFREAQRAGSGMILLLTASFPSFKYFPNCVQDGCYQYNVTVQIPELCSACWKPKSCNACTTQTPTLGGKEILFPRINLLAERTTSSGQELICNLIPEYRFQLRRFP